MISLKIYKYILLILIFLILLIGAYVILRSKLVKQIKIVIFWYIVILVLNLLNIYGIISFYEKNKNRKGPKGFKGIVGPRGLKGESILCESCGLSGQDNNHYGDRDDIEDENLLPGKCIYPFLFNYKYQNGPVTLRDNETYFKSKFPKLYQKIKDKNNLEIEICATKVNSSFEPTRIAFYKPNLGAELKSQKSLSDRRQQFILQNMGIVEIRAVYGDTYREAKEQHEKHFANYTFYDQDINEGTDGKFIYLVYLKSAKTRGITGLSIEEVKNSSETFVTDFIDNQPMNINKDSMKPDGTSADALYIKKEYGFSGFIKNIKIIKGNDPNKTKIEEEWEKIDDLNKGAHDSDTSKQLLLYIQTKIDTSNNIDTAFVYRDNILYFFKGNHFHKLSEFKKESLYSTEKKPLNQKWGQMPSMSIKNDEITDNCNSFNSKGTECNSFGNCFYDSVSKKCEFRKVYDAVFTNQNNETFLFKSQYVYKLDDKLMKIASGYPKLISDVFEGIPSNIDAVFVWGKDKKTYFFKGPLYYRLNSKNNKIDRGYPKKTKNRWPNMPSIVNAIFTLSKPVYGTNESEEDTSNYQIKQNIDEKNPTYIISSNKVYYINKTDEVKDTDKTINYFFKTNE